MILARSSPFAVQITHDQQQTAEFVLHVNGMEVARKPIDPAGVQFAFPEGLPPGAYEFLVDAVGPTGLTSSSDPVAVRVAQGHPAKPQLVVVPVG